jgi:hypothetical protein
MKGYKSKSALKQFQQMLAGNFSYSSSEVYRCSLGFFFVTREYTSIKRKKVPNKLECQLKI